MKSSLILDEGLQPSYLYSVLQYYGKELLVIGIMRDIVNPLGMLNYLRQPGSYNYELFLLD